MTKHRDNGSTNNQIELVTSSSVPPIENKAKMSKQRNESQEVISHVDPAIQNAIAVMPNEVVKQRPKTRGDPSGPAVYLKGTRPNHIRVGS